MDYFQNIDPIYVFYVCGGLAVALAVEAIYLLFSSKQGYRSRVNRRLKVLSDEPDRELALIQLRRERGLGDDGGFITFAALNRLVVQSGVRLGIGRLLVLVAFIALAAFVAVWVYRRDAGLAAGAAMAALVLPFFVLRYLRGKRWKKFGEQFPGAIDVIVRSLRAGHPVPVAVAMVAREMPDPVGSEFGMVSDEITYGADMETAMRALTYRVGQEDLPLFVTSVAIQGTTGGNLSQILENLSHVIRERFKMRRKIRALASEGKASAIILSAIPPIVFAIVSGLNPSFYGDVWDHPWTKPGLAGAACWMVVGMFVMRKMINFKF